MESLVLTIVSKYLKDYVNNFRREQLSLNFLRGQGVMRDLDINVDAINEVILRSCPGLRIMRILINKLSIEAPIMSLKTKPITVFIDSLFIEIVEVPDVVKHPKINRILQHKRSVSKYGFLDRIADSLAFEVNRVVIAFRPLGSVKSGVVSNATPPILLAELSGNRIFCTNHNGIETALDECFRVRPTKRPMLFVYKRLETKRVSTSLINPSLWASVADDIINGKTLADISRVVARQTRSTSPAGLSYSHFRIMDNVPLTLQMCARKRLDNNLLLGLEISLILDTFKACIKQRLFAELLRFYDGLISCLCRADAVQQVYGADHLHGEVSGTGSAIAASSSLQASTTMGANAGATTPTLTSSREKLSRESLGTEDIASLDILEAEVGPGVAVVTDERDREDHCNRSSLNSDEDPPHLRLVFALEVNNAIITLPFDPQSGGETSLSAETTAVPQGPIRGVVFTIGGVVFTNVWPEHTAITESVKQVTIKSVSLHHYIGAARQSLARTCEPMDMDGTLLPLPLIPRGVKEHSLHDPEYMHGTSFVFREESSWPASAALVGVASEAEMHCSAIEVNFNAKSIKELHIYITGAIKMASFGIESRSGNHVETCKKGPVALKAVFLGLLIRLQSEVRSYGILHYPAILVNVPLFTLTLSPFIEMETVLSLIPKLKQNMVTDQKNAKIGKSFPFLSTDLTSALKVSFLSSPQQYGLLSPRFEVTFSNIVVYVIDDGTMLSAPSSSCLGDEDPPRRIILECSSLSVLSSLDLNPSLSNKCAATSSTVTVGFDVAAQYSRRFYLTPQDSTIRTQAILGEGVRAYLSPLDIVRLIDTIEGITKEFKVYMSDNLYKQGDPINSSVIRIACVKNFALTIEPSTSTTSATTRDSGEPVPLAVLYLKNLILCVERRASIDGQQEERGLPNELLKCLVSGAAVTDALKRPLVFFTVDEIQRVVEAACTSGFDPFKWLSPEPAVALRIQFSHPEPAISASKAHLVLAEVLPSFRLLVEAKLLPECIKGILRDIVAGTSVIRPRPGDDLWWAHSVYGFFSGVKNHQDDMISGKGWPNFTAKILGKSLDFAVIDSLPVSSDFVSCSASFRSLTIALAHAPDNNFSLAASLDTKMQLLLYAGNIGQRVPVIQLCDFFSIAAEVSKSGDDTLQFKSSVALLDLLSAISNAHAKLFKTFLSDVASSIVHVQNLFHAFQVALQAPHPIFTVAAAPFSVAPSISSLLHSDSTTLPSPSTRNAMSIVKSSIGILRRNRIKLGTDVKLTENIGTDISTVEGSSDTLQRRVTDIRAQLTDGHVHISVAYKLVLELKVTVLESLAQALTVSSRCDRLLQRVADGALATTTHSRVYCGWVRRSQHGFAGKGERTVSGNSRSWAVLTANGVLYFLRQPYSNNTEMSIYLDGHFVIDPDDEESGGAKGSLSSLLWVVNDSGTLTLDAVTLDEKNAWFNSLRKWTIVTGSNSGGASRHRSTLFTSLAIGMGSHSSGAFLSGDSEAMPSTVKLDQVDIKGASGSSSIHRKTFKSATKHVLRAFSLSSSSLSSSSSKESGKDSRSAMQFLSGSGIINTLGGGGSSKPPVLSAAVSEAYNKHLGYETSNSERSSPVPPERMDSSLSLHSLSDEAQRSSITFAQSAMVDDEMPADSFIRELDELRLTAGACRMELQKAYAESVSLCSSARDAIHIAQAPTSDAALSAAALAVEINEVIGSLKEKEKGYHEIIRHLTNSLREEKEKGVALMQKWTAARRLQLELESVLHATSAQHAGTLYALQKQYTDMREQYSALRKGNGGDGYTPIGGGGGVIGAGTAAVAPGDFRELVRHLTLSISDMETIIRESDDRAAMMQQDLRSAQLELRTSNDTVTSLRAELQVCRARDTELVGDLERRLLQEQTQRERLESENDLLKAQLLVMSQTLQHFDESDRSAEIIS